jgi:hypothetical protein
MPTGQSAATTKVGLIRSVYLDLTSIKLDNAVNIAINLEDMADRSYAQVPSMAIQAVMREHLDPIRSRTTAEPDFHNCDQSDAHVGSSSLGRAG